MWALDPDSVADQMATMRSLLVVVQAIGIGEDYEGIDCLHKILVGPSNPL
jgi:hypothetical protein